MKDIQSSASEFVSHLLLTASVMAATVIVIFRDQTILAVLALAQGGLDAYQTCSSYLLKLLS